MSEAKEIKSIADFVTKDGNSGYKAEKGRYHLYVSHGCPFAHRVTLYVALKGLEDVISADVVDPVNDQVNGWEFTPEKRGCTPDRINGKKYLKEVYQMSHSNYTGRITVPVLFDKQTGKIVSNESADIIRMLNHEFDEFCATKDQAKLEFYPENKKAEIDEWNDWMNKEVIYQPYKAVGADNQDEYYTQVKKLFDGFDLLDELLSKQRFLVGNELTEADIRLFVFLIRFDMAYFSLSKCNLRRVTDYKHLWGYLRDLYQLRSVSSTVNFDHIKEIYWSNKKWNPSGIIPAGPILNFDEYSGRDKDFNA